MHTASEASDLFNAARDYMGLIEAQLEQRNVATDLVNAPEAIALRNLLHHRPDAPKNDPRYLTVRKEAAAQILSTQLFEWALGRRGYALKEIQQIAVQLYNLLK